VERVGSALLAGKLRANMKTILHRKAKDKSKE
jgi:hypothetical protein